MNNCQEVCRAIVLDESLQLLSTKKFSEAFGERPTSFGYLHMLVKTHAAARYSPHR